MEIKMRWVSSGLYADVSVTEGPTKIDIGLMNQSERAALVSHLKEVIEEIEYHDASAPLKREQP
jgi:hypothetical protein